MFSLQFSFVRFASDLRFIFRLIIKECCLVTSNIVIFRSEKTAGTEEIYQTMAKGINNINMSHIIYKYKCLKHFVVKE